MSQYHTIVHLVAGGLGGTAGAIATCPLEVVKTRLQSSVSNFGSLSHPVQTLPRFEICSCTTYERFSPVDSSRVLSRKHSFGIWRCIKHIIETEGSKALFKGLGPNLIGVAPSRAVYFCTYSHIKSFCNKKFTPDTPVVHICSAAAAGFVSCSLTNPIWLVKTRLQLEQRSYGNSTTTLQSIKDIYKAKGVKGFYKGITASYFGISETIVHFVIYEFIKAKLREQRSQASCSDRKSTRDFVEFMCAGAVSKTCASCIAYPHEVIRTRLRQVGDKYKSFFQTFQLVYKEESYHGLYRGLATQLVRQIPNTAIMMATYEAVVYLLTNCANPVSSIQICDDEEPY